VAGTLSTPPYDAEGFRTGLTWPRSGSSPPRRRCEQGSRRGRANDLVIAAAELAANTLIHTSEPGTLTIWATNDELICQVQDQGQITDPQAGMLRPPDAPGGGRGLWVVYQVCDQVGISTGQAGTTVRVHTLRCRISVQSIA
jgi:anti-sigma regulatory factor (Ser/Thr protein kinase)